MTRPVHDAQPVVHRAVLRLLDHQVVGPDGELLGNIDDLELLVSDEGWSVTALLVGPAALGRRLPGRLGRWTVAIWRRLRTDPHPRPCRVPFEQVHDIGSAVTVTRSAADSLAASFGLELWLREYVVSRIPGAKGGGDERDSERDGHPDRGRPETRQGTKDATATRGGRVASLAGLVRARVFAEDGTELGVVDELLCAEPPAGRLRDHLRVTHVEYGLHESGSELGYSSDAGQGPLVVGALVRWWQRGNRVAPLEDVDHLDLDAGTLRVRSHTHHVHPYAL